MISYNDEVSIQIVNELEPVVERELNRHLSISKMWYPHEYIPWSNGENFDGPLNGTKWEKSQSKIPSLVADSLFLSIITEDNLPQYHTELALSFDRNKSWKEWLDRWTAEESRHGSALRDYALTTRAVDPVDLENTKIFYLSKDFKIPSYKQDATHTIFYATLQELATRIVHKNTGVYSNDPVGEDLMSRIAFDENLHMIFYRNLATETFDINKDAALEALKNVIVNFEMPGRELPGFEERSKSIAMADIYNTTIHLNDILMPTIKYWDLEHMSNLSQNSEKNIAIIFQYIEKIKEVSSRFEEKRAAFKALQHDII